MLSDDRIRLIHGSGGVKTAELIDLFKEHFNNDILNELSDSAILKLKGKSISYSTDSFVISPYFYKGGSIGSLAITGTANDILMTGAKPKFFTCSFILGTSLKFTTLKKIVKDMSIRAKENNIKIVTGDTKVIKSFDEEGGIIINTSGIGESMNPNFKKIKSGDKIIVSGNLGEHQATILSARMNLKNNIKSDEAVLADIVEALIKNNINLKFMRDITRGGLSTVLNEIAESKGCRILINEEMIPVSKQVMSLSKMLGLNVLEMANEGKMLVIVPKEDEQRALKIIRNTKNGKNAKVVGEISEMKKRGEGSKTSLLNPNVIMRTKIGGQRTIKALEGEGLPRIC